MKYNVPHLLGASCRQESLLKVRLLISDALQIPQIWIFIMYVRPSNINSFYTAHLSTVKRSSRIARLHMFPIILVLKKLPWNTISWSAPSCQGNLWKARRSLLSEVHIDKLYFPLEVLVMCENFLLASKEISHLLWNPNFITVFINAL
jgi:hypothetical protein